MTEGAIILGGNNPMKNIINDASVNEWFAQQMASLTPMKMVLALLMGFIVGLIIALVYGFDRRAAAAASGAAASPAPLERLAYPFSAASPYSSVRLTSFPDWAST